MTGEGVQDEAAAGTLFRGIFESGLAGYVIADLNSDKPIAINDRLLEIIGYSRDEAEQTPQLWREITP
ncbi:MAG TPA: hypothetical protein VGB65_01680, partial [Allosphingosinicella sp.]